MHMIFWMDESYNAQLILKEIRAHWKTQVILYIRNDAECIWIKHGTWLQKNGGSSSRMNA